MERDALLSALRILDRATDPDDLADMLASRGMTGHRSMAGACPIARYLRSESGIGTSVTVQGSVIRIQGVPTGDGVSHEDELIMSPVMASFISRFDGGRYPQLERGRDESVTGSRHWRLQ